MGLNSPAFCVQGKSFPTSGNGGVVEAVTKWALKEAGVIKVVNVAHNKVRVGSRWLLKQCLQRKDQVLWLFSAVTMQCYGFIVILPDYV